MTYVVKVGTIGAQFVFTNAAEAIDFASTAAQTVDRDVDVYVFVKKEEEEDG